MWAHWCSGKHLRHNDGCFSLKGVPTRADIQTLLLDKVAGFENSNLALASISQATDEAVANVEAQTKRTAAGLKPEGQDEPLMIAIQEQLAAQFRSKDSWELEPKYQPSAAMIGRIRREFERRSPTIYNLIIHIQYRIRPEESQAQRRHHSGVWRRPRSH